MDMQITPRELRLLNSYRASELHGGLVLGGLVRGWPSHRSSSAASTDTSSSTSGDPEPTAVCERACAR